MKSPAYALRWLSIMKMYCGILPIWSNGCASEDKVNESLVKSTNPTALLSSQIYMYIDIYICEAIEKPISENNIGAPKKNSLWLGTVIFMLLHFAIQS